MNKPLTLIAFDTDGVFETLEETSSYVSGPVKVEWVEELEHNGYQIGIVSPSPYYPKVKGTKLQPRFPLFNSEASNNYRFKNLENFKNYFLNRYLEPTLCLYVSDNGDWREAQKAGFIYVDVVMFANSFSKGVIV